MKKPKESKKYSKKIYLDHASSTPIDAGVLNLLNKYQKEIFGNASSFHTAGIEAKNILDNSRASIAKNLFARPEEIIFTSGGTEGNNLAILGIINQLRITNYEFKNDKKNWQRLSLPHIVTTNIEHASVLEVCRTLEREKKATITYVPVEENGIVNPKKIKEALKPETVLVSVMYANNEIGTIQPIREIAKEIRHYRKNKLENQNSKFPFFHTDACQATNYLDIQADRLGVDLMSINSSKIYGPKGIGFLYVKKGTPIAPQILGGGQEFNFRSGTESVPLVGAFAEALNKTRDMAEKEYKKLIVLRNFLIKELKKKFPKSKINGDLDIRLPNNVSVSFPNFSSELLVIELDAKGYMVSSKSACHADDPDESYVLRAIGATKSGEEQGSLRITLGRDTKKEHLVGLVGALEEIFKKYKPLPDFI